ncbi:SDR family NAD(P)-dependent oxidoreductase [Streptomyces sp. NPDC005301]|uniref:SDR family NAD(P)-dependent oxidoreductase n=1 Tax=Streptomyces sp. NPDC005301 TaxID=3156874 RepID=UPI0033A4DBF5
METRTALVTGAAQGLGQEFAVALAGRGYRVAGLDTVPQPQTAGRVLDYVELVADVTDGVHVRRSLERVIERFGTLHVLVTVARALPEADFEDLTPGEWRRVMGAGLDVPFLLARAVLPYLKAAGWGRIVNVVPPAVRPGVARVAAQAGLSGFTRSLAAALGPYGITVNALVPGAVRTGAGRTAGADGGRVRVAPRTRERSGLVSSLLHLVDEGGGSVTGQTLEVSGGA